MDTLLMGAFRPTPAERAGDETEVTLFYLPVLRSTPPYSTPFVSEGVELSHPFICLLPHAVVG
jgi:hypothetical protein